jgi:hypothetical protein
MTTTLQLENTEDLARSRNNNGVQSIVRATKVRQSDPQAVINRLPSEVLQIFTSDSRLLHESTLSAAPEYLSKAVHTKSS